MDSDEDPYDAYQAAAARARGFRLIAVLLTIVVGAMILFGLCLGFGANSWNTFIMETIH